MKYPKKVQIETTNNCNLKCDGCLRKTIKRKLGFISHKIYVKTLQFLKEFSINEVHLHNWGEPLMHPYIIDSVSIAKALGFTVGFTTNGTLLTHDKLIKLKDAGLDRLDISYNKNTKDIRTLMNLYHISNDLGIETWFRSVVFSKKEYEDALHGMDDYYIRFQRGIYHDPNSEGRVHDCEIRKKLFIVQWNGIIVPCCAIYDNQYTYGEIGKITVDQLKEQIDLKEVRLSDYCRRCFEVTGDFPVNFKL